jgi:alpha-ribazole phosphatase
MSETTRWWWIRHAPMHNHGGRLYGRRDVAADLSDTAALQALAQRLPSKAAWLASPLSRTVETAKALSKFRAAHAEVPALAIEPEIIEQNFGKWQGLTYAEIAESHGGEPHAFWFAAAHATPEEGESFAETMARVSVTIERLTREHRGRDIVAVSHAGVIRSAVAKALDLGPEAALRLAIEPLSLTRLDHIERGGRDFWRVAGANIL